MRGDVDAPEQWRAVVGYEGRYEVSDKGRIRSFVRSPAGLLKPWWNGSKKRYLSVRLTCSQGGVKAKPIHHLVLNAFVGPRPDGQEGRHLNDISADNCVTNLAWGTRKENIEDARQIGRQRKGLKLTAAQAKEIRASSERHCELARRFNVSSMTIIKIRRGEVWKSSRITTTGA